MKRPVTIDIELFNKKDHIQFGLVYKKYYERLCLEAKRWIKDDHFVEDIVSGVFERIFEGLPRDYESERMIKNTLFLATRNACIDHKRKKGNTTVDYPGDKLPEDEDNITDQRIIYADIITVLHDIIGEMPGQRKKVAKMLISGMSVKEIAGALDISENTVREHQDKGIRQIKGVLLPGTKTIGLIIIFLLYLLYKKNF